MSDTYIPGHTSYNRHELNVAAARYNISNDRVYRDALTLPHDEKDIIIPANSIITSDLINNVSNKLFENYMYILSRCKIAKTDAFDSYRGHFELTRDTTNQVVTGAYSTEPTNTITNNLLDANIRSIDLINTSQPGVYGMVIASKSDIQLYNFIPSYKPYQNGLIVPVSQQQGESLVETNNQLQFSNIQKVLLDNNNSMYVYDSDRYVLYKYSIKGLTRQDVVLLDQETRGRQLLEIFGGRGNVSTPTQFNDVVDLTYDDQNDQIYVMDHGDGQYYIKLYDNQLNWLDSFNVSLDFRENTPLTIRTHQNKLYILTEPGLLYQYDVDDLISGIHDAQTVTDLQVIDFNFVDDEHYVDIVFSATSGNLCYVHTNKTIYKKYLTRLEKNVADIAWKKHNILDGEITPRSLTLHNRTGTVDDIMLMVVKSGDGENRLLHFIDTETVQEMLARNYEDQIFLLDDIVLNPNETVSSFVYNKYIFKFLYNNLTILNNLKYVATVEVGFTGDFLYPGIRYISQQDINQIISRRNKNVYVGVNELVTSGVINRVLSDIVVDQRLILEALVDRENDQDFYDNTVLVMENTPVPHIKHVISRPIGAQSVPRHNNTPDQVPGQLLLGGAHKIDKI